MDPIDGLKLQSHRYRLMRYPNTLTAVEIIDWLIKNEHASSRCLVTLALVVFSPIGYSVIVALTGLPIGYSVIVALIHYREMAVRLGQTLIDTKRLIVVNADQVFRDESHLFLEIGPVSDH